MANKDGHKEGSCGAMVTPMGSKPAIPLATHYVSSPVPVVSVPRASTPPDALKESGEVGGTETGWVLGGSDRTGHPASLSSQAYSSIHSLLPLLRTTALERSFRSDTGREPWGHCEGMPGGQMGARSSSLEETKEACLVSVTPSSLSFPMCEGGRVHPL